jgi:V/A-type H+/Na+-transporting ATPase subunit B
VDVGLSLSRLMKDGIGADRTRDDHAEVAAQLFASYARVRELRSLATIVGEGALSPTDRTYLEFGAVFEATFLAQGREESREIGATLDLAWAALSELPPSELHRIAPARIAARHHGAWSGRREAAP